MHKLPVIETVRQAMLAPVRFFWPLAPIYLVLQIGTVGVMGAFTTFGPEAGIGVTPANLPLAIVAGAVLFVGSIMILVLTHRLVAGMSEPWRVLGPFVGYLGLSLGLLAIAVAFIGLAVLVAGFVDGAGPPGSGGDATSVASRIVLPAIYAGLLVVLVRVSLALPAAALERPRPLALALRVSKGNTLRLIGAWMLLVVFVFAFAMAIILVAAMMGLVDFPPPDQAAGGQANPFDLADPSALVMLGINVIVNYVMTVASTGLLTYSLMSLQGRTPRFAGA